jgi:uroporphyrinogen III methyltransferase / synthase
MDSHKRGFVFLVGAGPGDPGLITVRAVDCLRRAEVVIHDRLLNPGLLDYAPPEAEIIDAGKQPEYHPKPQDQINALLVQKALEGKLVVRLKGGDPLVFGRGGEEALALVAAGIPFRIVPGVTSATAVPTYAGIPITQRGVASSLAVVAGHNIDSAENVDWPRLAQGADTLIFLMGVQTLPRIVEHLLAAGRQADTPVAIVERGTYPAQKTVTGTLGDIVARAAGLKPPATIIVGQVVTLREKLRWFDRLDLYPLFGLRILNTRPARPQGGDELSQQLEAEGAEVLEVPTTHIGPAADFGPLDQALERLRHRPAASPPPYAWALFTSANAVSAFMERLLAQGGDARALGGVKLGAVGAATAAALRTFGLAADRVPERFTALALADEMGDLTGQRVLLPRSDAAQPELVAALEARGADVDAVVAYSVGPARPSAPLLELLACGEIRVAVFFSPSALHGLAHMLGEQPLVQALAGVAVACVGPTTAEAARELGVNVAVTPEEHTVEGVVAALVKWRGTQTSPDDEVMK